MDIHIHVFFDGITGAIEDYDDDPEELLRVVDIDRLVGVGVIVVAPTPGIERARQLNDRLAEFVQRDPARLFAIGTVHPDDGDDALKELERIRALGFRMLKLHPITQRLDMGSDSVAAVVRKAGELGLPVLIDFSGILGASNLGEYLWLALHSPETCIVLAHMGGTRFHELLILSQLRRYTWYPDNLWFDLSGVAAMYARSPYVDQLVFVIRRLGVDRALFGSDYPFVRTPSEAIEDVEALGFTLEEKRMIFHDNAASLLGGGPAQDGRARASTCQ